MNCSERLSDDSNLKNQMSSDFHIFFNTLMQIQTSNGLTKNLQFALKTKSCVILLGIKTKTFSKTRSKLVEKTYKKITNWYRIKNEVQTMVKQNVINAKGYGNLK